MDSEPSQQQIQNQIIDLASLIFENLNDQIQIEFELKLLYSSDIYLQIFQIMFPFIENKIIQIANKHISEGKKLQSLIDLLSGEILTMDLSHIQGESIAKRDNRHLINFLQIIYELSKLFKDRQRIEGDNVIRTAPESRSYSNEEDIQRPHTVIGIDNEFEQNDLISDQQNQEFLSQQQQNIEDGQMDGQYQYQGDNKEQDGEVGSGSEKKEEQKSVIDEVSNSKEQSDYGDKKFFNNKGPKSSKKAQDKNQKVDRDQKQYQKEKEYKVLQEKQSSGESDDQDNKSQDNNGRSSQLDNHNQGDMDEDQRNNYVTTLKRNPSKKDLVQDNKAQKDLKKKQIDKQLFSQQKQQKILVNGQKLRPSTAKKSSTKGSGMKESQSDTNIQLDEKTLQQIRERIIELGGDPDDENQIIEIINQMQLKEDEEQVSEEGFENPAFNPQQDIKMEDIIDQQHKAVKDQLQNMRNYRMPEDSKITQQTLLKHRNQYKQFLKDYLRVYGQGQNQKENSLKELNKKVKERTMKNEAEKLKSEYEKEQMSLAYKLRDEKMNYLRKLHRIIFELEKRKIIDEKNFYDEQKKKRNEDTCNVLESIENAYRDRIQMLKENLEQKRKERHIATVAQREIVSKIERELRREKERQIKELKELWRQEKERFDELMKDDGVLEQKIVELYKKY